MKVDKNRFKELKKAAGGISKLECALTITIEEGFESQKNKSCNFNIYPNGIYFDFIFGDKIYYSIRSIKRVELSNRTVEIYIEDNEVIKIAIEKSKDIEKVYSILNKHLGKITYGLNVEKSYKEICKIKKAEEREKNKKEYEATMNAYREYKSQVGKAKTNDDVVKCPKCGSTSITANKKGFSLAKGAAGVLAAGAIGAVVAGHGKNKVIVTCLKCGHQWNAGK